MIATTQKKNNNNKKKLLSIYTLALKVQYQFYSGTTPDKVHFFAILRISISNISSALGGIVGKSRKN